MSRKKIFLMISGLAALAGFLLILCGGLLGGRVFGIGLSSSGLRVYTGRNMGLDKEYEEKEVELDEFRDIKLNVSYADIRIEPSDRFKIAYGFYDAKSLTVQVQNQCLNVSNKESGENEIMLTGFWGGQMAVKRQYITIYVPENQELGSLELYYNGDSVLRGFSSDTMKLTNSYGDAEFADVDCKTLSLKQSSGYTKIENMTADDVNINNGYGDADLIGLNFGELELVMNSGDAELSDLKGKNMFVENRYGSCDLDQVELSEELRLDLSSGDVELNYVSAAILEIQNGYGSIEGRKTMADDIVFDLSSGDCSMETLTADTIAIDDSYGSVELELTRELDAYAYDLNTDYGEIRMDNQDRGENYKSMGEVPGNRSLQVDCGSGDIEVTGRKK